MGANAQTTVPTFVDGQVLTAAQQNQSARTGVPVFADTTARDAAFGGAGEKTLAEGQLCYVENLTGVAQIQYYDGSNWVSLGASNFVYLTQATFSAVSTVSMPAATFTTTYKHYKVVLDVTSTSAGQALGVRVNVGGTPQTGNLYFGGFVTIANNNTVAGLGTNADTNALLGYIHSTTFAHFDLTVFNPASSTIRTNWSGTGRGATSGGDTAGTSGGNFYNSAAAHDGLTFVVPGTFGGTYYVYGMRDN